MSYIFDRIDYFRCLVRREFTANHKRHKGEYLPAFAVGVRCQRGLALYFQVWFQDPLPGPMFLLPIHALCFKPCAVPPLGDIQPWDVFSPHFSVSRLDLFHRSRAYVLPRRLPGRYMMTLDFDGSEIAEDMEQHKQLHLVELDCGWLAAVPNNRVLIEDRAFTDNGVIEKRPDFKSLEPTYRSEL